MATLLLLVEDETDRTLLVEWVREATGHEVLETPGQLSAESFDLCICDPYSMEHRAETLRQLRDDADPIHLPCVLVVPSSQASSEQLAAIDRIYGDVVDDLLEMPVVEARLARIVENALELRRRTQELAQTRDRLRRFERAAEAMPHAYYRTETDGTIEYVNPGFETVTGYTAEEAIGRTPAILQSGEQDDDYYRELWETIEAGEVWYEEVLNRRKDGELYHADQMIAPVFDDTGTIDRYIAIQTDVSERKKRTRQLEVLDRILRHNLSNDLNVIAGRAEIVRREATGSVERQAAVIMDKSESLTETADKQRQIVREIVERTEPEAQDVVEVVSGALERARTSHPEAVVEATLPPSAPAVASPTLGRAIEELLDNAIAHNDADRPRVEVAVEVGAECIEITIEDDGPGIPEIEMEVLTDGKSIDPLFHGQGLGLWLVNWIVHFSNGSLEFTERDPNGSRVAITLSRETSSPSTAMAE